MQKRFFGKYKKLTIFTQQTEASSGDRKWKKYLKDKNQCKTGIFPWRLVKINLVANIPKT